MFVTDDITQKIIIVNVHPAGQCAQTIDAIFTTKTQKKVNRIVENKTGRSSH